jgi:hypothetical protein
LPPQKIKSHTTNKATNPAARRINPSQPICLLPHADHPGDPFSGRPLPSQSIANSPTRMVNSLDARDIPRGLGTGGAWLTPSTWERVAAVPHNGRSEACPEDGYFIPS